MTGYLILGMENPLLDISANVDEAFLAKYSLKANDAILAEESHKQIFTDLEKCKVQHIAGGTVRIKHRYCIRYNPGAAQVTICDNPEHNARSPVHASRSFYR